MSAFAGAIIAACCVAGVLAWIGVRAWYRSRRDDVRSRLRTRAAHMLAVGGSMTAPDGDDASVRIAVRGTTDDGVPTYRVSVWDVDGNVSCERWICVSTSRDAALDAFVAAVLDDEGGLSWAQ